MTTEQIRKVRSEARSMTLDQLREAHADALSGFALAGTQESAQHFHDLAGELAEVYQRAVNPSAYARS